MFRSFLPIRWALVAAVGGGWACGAGPISPSSIVNGAWGGDHIVMTVAGAATHLEFDCAHGDIAGPLKPDARGQFSVAGTFVREHGGPIRVDEVLERRPALYGGSVMNTSMTLTIRLTDTSESIGTFVLMHGVSGRVVKCL